MNPTCGAKWKCSSTTLTLVLIRWLLGGLFLYMGLNKALHPVEFLKLLRQYDLVPSHLLLNLLAATLPWFEVFCGLLLLAGVAVRGSALLLVGMLVPFTAIVAQRAVAIHAAGGMPFCAIKFDCGCGGGEVLVCGKLIENILLTLLSAVLVCSRKDTLCLRHSLAKGA
ncbi:MAG: DoxX family membrane protein [Verrucomicrobia bacterium]|nr:DoxX family membrane protein [Verrucomicrobiota bacterium]